MAREILDSPMTGFTNWGEPKPELIEQLVGEGNLPRYYKSCRRIYRVMGREPTSKEIAWELTQLDPLHPTSEAEAKKWEGCHEALVESFSGLISKRVYPHQTADQESIERLIQDTISRRLKFYADATTPEEFAKYLNKSILFLSRFSYSLLDRNPDYKTVPIDSYLSESLSTQVDSERHMALSIPAIGPDNMIAIEGILELYGEEIDKNLVWQIYEDTGDLKAALESIFDQLNMNEATESEEDTPETIPRKQKHISKRNITLNKKGNIITQGYNIDQVYDAIFRLPYDQRYLALYVTGYLDPSPNFFWFSDKNDRDSAHLIRENPNGQPFPFHRFSRRFEKRFDELTGQIQRRLGPKSIYPRQLRDIIAELNTPVLKLELRRRFTVNSTHRRGIEFSDRSEIIRRFLGMSHIHPHMLNKIQLREKTEKIINVLLTSTDPVSREELIRRCGIKPQESLYKTFQPLLSQLDFSFPETQTELKRAFSEHILDNLTENEERYLKDHYGIESGNPLTVGEISKKYRKRLEDVHQQLLSACFKTMDRLFDVNGRVFLAVKLLNAQDLSRMKYREITKPLYFNPLFRHLLGNEALMVINLYYFQNRPEPEIASALQINPSTLRVRIHYLKHHILKAKRAIHATEYVYNSRLAGNLSLPDEALSDFTCLMGSDNSEQMSVDQIAAARGITPREVRRNIRAFVFTCNKFYQLRDKSEISPL